LARENLKKGFFIIKPKNDISSVEFKILEDDFKKILAKIN